ncbi:MAG: insulinase family protein [Candidatus Omnitrophica bacterium]|nr:insulinase family protein [Candidatus Omnitrophota bacterium]
MGNKEKLSNGLRIVTKEMPNKQSVALGIWIDVGGRHENKKEKGIAHFLEHLSFKGSKKYTCRQIKESIEGVGGSLNGFTSEEATCYLVKLPVKHLSRGLDILSDMVTSSSILKEEVDKERTVIIEEIKMYKDLPQSYVYELLDELLWPEHPLGMSIAGSIESVNGITDKDLLSFQKKHYTAPNIVVSAAGNIRHENFTKKIKSIFSVLEKKGLNSFIEVKESQSTPKIKVLAKDTEQTHLALGLHSFKRQHPLRHAVTLLNIILGANMSSRLFNELREKRGLAYEIGTQVKRYRDTGAFIVHAGIDNQKVGEAISLILKELVRSKKELVSLDEFRRAKEFFLGQLMLALEDTLDHMLWIGESTVALNKTYSLAEIVKEINKVTREDIRNAAKAIFKRSSLNLALIGPGKEGEKTIANRLHL